jgi:NADPH-dependent 2,4-dienoyl-CoA reductase/sulfur reductase-like enzyme/peroxiredoxin family protein/rhodanese-related sulfurtransferase/TusA-related sulfurtransferase
MKLVVIGGVAAGMSLAARTRRLDESADIVVLERSRHVSYANCGLPYHVGGVIRDRDQLLLQTPESLRAALNLDVRTGHEVLAIDRATKRVRVREVETGREYDEPYDKLGLCPGAQPIRPPIPGIDLIAVHVLRNVEDMDAIKTRVDAGVKSVVVVGGGYIGIEMAENLRHRTVSVDLVEMAERILPPLDPEMVTPLEDHLRLKGVRLHLGTAAAAIRGAEGGRVAVELKSGETLPADLVILAAGVRPDTSLAKAAGLQTGPRGGILVDERLRTSDPDIVAAGDAVEVRHAVLPGAWAIPLAGPANRQGRAAAETILGRETAAPVVQGTSIVQVFDMTAGGTGASETTMKRAGLPCRKIYVHPAGHASYYPGTAPMHIKLIFAPDTGRVLGAQVVGHDGVDKRIDVLATAIRGGMTVYDLERLELAYAPPYGSAKDPVNMAGFVAANLLRGDVAFWYAEEYPERTAETTLIDVRGPEEFETWHIPGAVNIPLGHFRRSLDRIPRERPVRLYCKVGFRSYLAYRILVQSGFTDVATLSGGTLTFRAWHRPPAKPDPAENLATIPYLEEQQARAAIAPASGSGRVVEVDCAGLQCPGPIQRLKAEMEKLSAGDELVVRATDPGFPADSAAWCGRLGHAVVSVTTEGPTVVARLRKGAAATAAVAVPACNGCAPAQDKKAFVVFSGDLDKVMAAFVIANGALAMGSAVTMFFTFWGLNVLRRADAPPVEKGLMDRMFGAMMPKGPDALKLSKMNMLGMGTAMMKKTMQEKRVASLPKLVESARKSGAKLVACTMTMDVMGLKKEELIDGIEYGGVATFLAESDQARTTFFI